MPRYYQARMVRIKERDRYGHAVMNEKDSEKFIYKDYGHLIFARSIFGTYREVLTKKKVGKFGKRMVDVTLPCDPIPYYSEMVCFFDAKDYPFLVDSDNAKRVEPEFVESTLKDYVTQVNGVEGMTAFFNRIQKEYDDEMEALEEQEKPTYGPFGGPNTLTLKPENNKKSE